MDRYAVMIYWSDEDELFIAYAPDLPGCMAHGDTREEALANVQDAMDLWIEVARRRGDRVPESMGRELMFA